MEEIGEKWDVPMLRREGHPKARGGGGGEGRFAMMDVAYYYNSKSFNLPNCLKHSDPGLQFYCFFGGVCVFGLIDFYLLTFC